MKVLNIHGVDDIRVDEVPEPGLDSGDVLIKVQVCGVCGSDLSYIKRGGLGGPGGLPGAAMPMPLGHEASGVVVKAGSEVSNDIRVGMRVIINPMGTPGLIIGNGASEGAFATYLKMRKPRLNRDLFEVPEGVSGELAALAEPLAVSFHAVDRADPKPGEKAAVFGVGPIGLGAVIGLKRRNIDVVAVDMSAARLELAKHFGASHTIQAGEEDVAEKLAEYHGSEGGMGKHAVGTDIFIDAAGAPTVVPEIIDMTKLHARLVIPAVYFKEVPVNFSRMLRSEMSVIMSKGYSSFPPVIEAITDLGDELKPFISHRFDFEHVLDALQASGQKSTAAKVMVTFPE